MPDSPFPVIAIALGQANPLTPPPSSPPMPPIPALAPAACIGILDIRSGLLDSGLTHSPTVRSTKQESPEKPRAAFT